MRISPSFAGLSLLLVGSATMGQEPVPAPAIRIQVDRPDRQLLAVLNLFQKAKAKDPASALAAWKRASQEPGRLGKPVEALIASFNPRMVDELKALDGAEVLVWFDITTGQPEWSAIIPRDDGTFAALATTMVLSGGAAESPIEDQPVDRLGGAGSPLMTRTVEGTLLFSSNRQGLSVARRGLSMVRPASGRDRPGLITMMGLSEGFSGSKSLNLRRLAEALRPFQGEAALTLAMNDSDLIAGLSINGLKPVATAAVDPTWLAWIPRDRAMAGFALAVDPRPEFWNAVFDAFDRVERVDPLRANVAPSRLRLDLLARTLGIRTEADLFPHLKGVSGWVGAAGKSVDSVMMAFHLDNQASAERLLSKMNKIPEVIDGRPLKIARWETSVVLAWGEGVLESTSLARTDPARSAGPEIRKQVWREDGAYPCAGALWPGRIPGLCPRGTPLASVLDEAPPMSWKGEWRERVGLSLNVVWPDLDAMVEKFLDRIPLDPPPAR